MIKAIFFDVDGTLVSFRDHKVPESTRFALNKLKDKGIKMFISTGRSPRAFDKVKKLIDFDFDGYIYHNGQYVEVGGLVIRDVALPLDDLRKALDYVQAKGLACTVSENDYSYINLIDDRMRKMHEWLGATIPKRNVESFSRIERARTYQISPYILEEEEEDFFSNLPNLRGVRWNPYFTDVIPKEGGKAVGIASVLEHFGIDQNSTMAFGDGGNDSEMLEYVGLGIAMGNALESTKLVSDYVTDHVDEDGLYNALVRYGVIE